MNFIKGTLYNKFGSFPFSFKTDLTDEDQIRQSLNGANEKLVSGLENFYDTMLDPVEVLSPSVSFTCEKKSTWLLQCQGEFSNEWVPCGGPYSSEKEAYEGMRYFIREDASDDSAGDYVYRVVKEED